MNRLIIVLLALFVAGCATTERKAKSYYLDHKDQLAELCKDCFPVKEIYIKGEEVYLKPDTVFKKGDTVVVEADCPDGSKAKVKCPPNDTIEVYIPVMRIDTMVKADSAAIFYWKNEYLKLEKEKKNLELDVVELKEDKSYWMKRAWIFGGIIGLYIGFSIFRRFTII